MQWSIGGLLSDIVLLTLSLPLLIIFAVVWLLDSIISPKPKTLEDEKRLWKYDW